jgi:hypothetical protein
MGSDVVFEPSLFSAPNQKSDGYYTDGSLMRGMLDMLLATIIFAKPGDAH